MVHQKELTKPAQIRYPVPVTNLSNPVAQLISPPPCHGGSRGFKSPPGRKDFGVVLFKADIRTLFGLVAELVG
jgi:hypothetical protein